MNHVFELYQDFLTGLEFKIQETIMSQPVDLSNYINLQKDMLRNTENPMKSKLLESYIEHGESYTKSNKMTQRHRYIVYGAPIQDHTEEAFFEAIKDLEEKTLYITSGVNEFELSALEVSNKEIIKYFHMMFDYKSAQLYPIGSESIPQIIIGGKKHDEIKIS
ncbi:hypothetical protein [Peribacillus frigoritolerans]|uniref:hypothetical protein n=1 Tax=Peribacillus frigoritolerans TaxID=450367 RepID=UPI0023DB548C|nr:hypothetical protein [Peribacillus frigoritolerans]MDF1995806.1 hypothetical protein [Peribacillus frigoritolerans]